MSVSLSWRIGQSSGVQQESISRTPGILFRRVDQREYRVSSATLPKQLTPNVGHQPRHSLSTKAPSAARKVRPRLLPDDGLLNTATDPCKQSVRDFEIVGVLH